MNILVICPLKSEYDNFVRSLKCVEVSNNYYPIKVGVGIVSAAVSTALELYKKSTINYDLILIVGYAAGSKLFEQGELVFPNKCKFAYANCPEQFSNLGSTFDLQGSDEVNILTSDRFIDAKDSSVLVEQNSSKVIFDMESAAVCQVASDFDIPVLVAKYISDVPEAEHNLQTFEDFTKTHTDFRGIILYVETLINS